MAVINFPSNPSNGNTHTEAGKTWTWDGVSWKLTSTGGTSSYTLPIAAAGILGGIKVGSRLTIDPATGTLSADIQSSGGGGGASVTTDDTPPASPNDGDLWWNSASGDLKVYYEDVNSSQWVDANSKGGTSFSGSYNDLSDKPTLFDGDYTSLSNLPTLFDGDYNSLSNLPTLSDTNDYVDAASLSGTDLVIGRTGALADITVDLSTLGGGGTDNYVDAAALSGTDLVIGRTGALADLTVDLSTLGGGGTDTNDYVDAASLNSNILVIGRTGALADLSVDLSPLSSPSSTQNQAEYTTPGTYWWNCPAGVTSVCVVCVGGGGFGAGDGGGGGGLGWKNNITVVPGQNYQVEVGGSGSANNGAWPAGSGGDSYFINDTTVKGGGGGDGGPSGNSYIGVGGNYVGDGGGDGGDGSTGAGWGGGGGGAGGYAGNGGDAGQTSGNGGAGGGGGGAAGHTSTDSNDTKRKGGGGGGVGIRGQGTSGAGAPNTTYGGDGGFGGSGGEDGDQSDTHSSGKGGAFGGGSGGTNDPSGAYSRPAGTGAVRIMWGAGRSYPSTDTENQYISTFTGLHDTPNTFTADKWLKVNSGGTALEWVDAPTGTLQDLQNVTDQGKITTNDITAAGFTSDGDIIIDYDSSANNSSGDIKFKDSSDVKLTISSKSESINSGNYWINRINSDSLGSPLVMTGGKGMYNNSGAATVIGFSGGVAPDVPHLIGLDDDFGYLTELYGGGQKVFTTQSDGVQPIGALYDKDDQKGTAGQILSSTGTALDWIDPPTGGGGGGSGVILGYQSVHSTDEVLLTTGSWTSGGLQIDYTPKSNDSTIILTSYLNLHGSSGAGSTPTGQQNFTSPGTHNWTCPADVTSVCAVCIGGGGSGWGNTSSSITPGGGGGLGWKNNITVVPGQTYTVQVGAAGGDSYFMNDTTVKGGAGGGSPVNYGAAGTFVGDGGGNGANGIGVWAGGGAGGYTGDGGKGGFSTTTASSAGAGGGGGGGGGGSFPAAGGGGVGILGEGANGAGGNEAQNLGGQGGSGGGTGGSGSSGGGGYGGAYGGGGGVGDQNNYGGAGAQGAVRLIWGEGRSYPNTLTTDQNAGSTTTEDRGDGYTRVMQSTTSTNPAVVGEQQYLNWGFAEPLVSEKGWQFTHHTEYANTDATIKTFYVELKEETGELSLNTNDGRSYFTVMEIDNNPSGGGGSDPIGTITIWSGTTSNVPIGYQLCDGGAATTAELQAINANVPDLRNKFIIGAGVSGATTNYITQIAGTAQEGALENVFDGDLNTFALPNGEGANGITFSPTDWTTANSVTTLKIYCTRYARTNDTSGKLWVNGVDYTAGVNGNTRDWLTISETDIQTIRWDKTGADGSATADNSYVLVFAIEVNGVVLTLPQYKYTGETGGSADAILPLHDHGTGGVNGGTIHAVRRGADAMIDAISHEASNNDAHYDTTSVTDPAGADATDANLPPYYSLCYIIKNANYLQAISGHVVSSPNGTAYRLLVSDAGVLSTVAV